jgi:membrane protein DedA with SNARE-associated domain
VAIYLFLGIVTADFMYYLIGRSKSFEKIKRIKIVGKIFERVDSTIDLMTWKHVNLAFFYCKFITGAKFVIDAYLGKKGVKPLKFILMTFLAAIIWSSVAFLIGFYSGKGFIWVLTVFESLTLGFLFIMIIVAVFYKFLGHTKKYIHHKIN